MNLTATVFIVILINFIFHTLVAPQILQVFSLANVHLLRRLTFIVSDDLSAVFLPAAVIEIGNSIALFL